MLTWIASPQTSLRIGRSSIPRFTPRLSNVRTVSSVGVSTYVTTQSRSFVPRAYHEHFALYVLRTDRNRKAFPPDSEKVMGAKPKQTALKKMNNSPKTPTAQGSVTFLIFNLPFVLPWSRESYLIIYSKLRGRSFPAQ